MMSFRKRATKSGKGTSGNRTLPLQQREQCKSYIDKKVFERPSDSTVKISFLLG